MSISPLKDGIGHINMYSQGETDLGQFLSNFYEIEVETPDGKFNSIEAYWYWLASNEWAKEEALNRLREMSGLEAKKFGRMIKPPDRIYIERTSSPEFKSKIMKAIWSKIINSSYHFDFVNSELPFEHYYVYDGNWQEPDHVKWLTERIEKLRDMMKKSKIEEREGDLFEVDNSFSLAHCVSSDGKMGAGIAQQFAKKFEGIRNSVEEFGVGEAAPYESEERKIYNLITKEKYFHKPTKEDLEASLFSLREKMILNGEFKLAMPRIASGLDGMEWKNVKEIIKDVFEDTGIFILVKVL